ncbi:arginyltransferase [Calycomorphotria hydatis]|uniref:Aspartate/glutamate leucyltransferase n=1 Tax=Calycomorphotria hydatis TaxID=2528027 RepID=A0A517T4X6_9PLAN|nr:arginyltransferase [Calycomorphotria hydatis]QDT63401.1 arginyl-tRNA-protein transferase [Calycomorphotria hydatis]
MTLELLHDTSPPAECSYLPAETMSLEYKLLTDLPALDFEKFLERGWRRQGISFFRPACPQCNKCRSLRVPVNEFQPTKSQRRSLKKNSDVQLVVRTPTLTSSHLWVYDAYHRDMSERRHWKYDPTTPEDYARSFLSGEFAFAREFLYFRHDQLIGVGLVDVLPHAMSSIYFYHDPDWRADGPGTYSIMKELEYARELGIEHYYLGYWIKENASMAYKHRFQPHEILQSYPSDEEQPVWQRTEATDPHKAPSPK